MTPEQKSHQNIDQKLPTSKVEEPLIAVVDFAEQLQLRKQTVFKVMARLGIRATKHRDSSNRRVEESRTVPKRKGRPRLPFHCPAYTAFC